MLMLNRRKGQTVLIGDVEIVVAEVHRGECRLGITAPPGIEIIRGELRQKPRTPHAEHRDATQRDNAAPSRIVTRRPKRPED